MQCILASSSPRRKFLLELMGLDVRVIPSQFEEYFSDELSLSALVEELSIGKAVEVAQRFPKDIIIAGDTLVYFEGKPVGKPKNKTEALKTLTGYRGKSCTVVSATAVVCNAKDISKSLSASSIITFKNFDDVDAFDLPVGAAG